VARITKSNVQELQEKLLKWYDMNGREFPWRKPGLTHYQFVVTEVLLQRTKAETVSAFYSVFTKRYPTWIALATDSIKNLELALKPIGLFRQRAKRLHALAVEMVRRKGRFPDQRNELESMPFLGQYIVNSIELLLFNRNRPLLDVNMARVLERYFQERQMADIRYDPFLQKLAYLYSDHAKSREVNWAILDFAAKICRSRNPLCPVCPVSRKCSYARKQVHK
jgi:A/G-specific adenine glycosylase